MKKMAAGIYLVIGILWALSACIDQSKIGYRGLDMEITAFALNTMFWPISINMAAPDHPDQYY